MFSGFTSTLENILFHNRKVIVAVFFLITVILAYSATMLRVDAGFQKLLPLEHEYMQTFIQYKDQFGGANRILVALVAKDGNMFTPEFFQVLKEATDDVFFIPGVDRSQVRSLFTPNVRFTEVVEDGISGGNVIPSDFEMTEEGLNRVKENIIKAGIVGRLVSNDFSGAMISAQLLEINPNTGEKLDYVEVAGELEKKIRGKYSGSLEDVHISFHIIGFAKIIGDITDGAKRIVVFFLLTIILTTLLVVYYSQSVKAALIPVFCSLIAVIWQMGLLPILGFGIDPMSILVPFLIFAIGVSHGVQMISAIRVGVFEGLECEQACRNSFSSLFIPGSVALLSDTMGFITILLIKIEIIQEMAITASIGVAAIILTNLFLLPLMASFVDFDSGYHEKLNKRARYLLPIWLSLSRLTEPAIAKRVLLVAGVLFIAAFWQGSRIKVGDQHRGVPELRVDSKYNLDSELIANKFSIGVDILTVIAESVPEACIRHDAMITIDEFAWAMENTNGVQSVMTLPYVAKRINAGWNEGHLNWYTLPRNQSTLTQAVSYVPTSSGLLNNDCSVMPIYIFTEDHKAETINHIIDKIKVYRQSAGSDLVNFRLATGNVGVMAATNEEVQAAQFPILIYVFSAIIILCMLAFRSIRGTLCIIIPLTLVSLLSYALMSLLEIGLKVNTLPVVALGVGIGVDYGIYIYNKLSANMKSGMDLKKAYAMTLATTGYGVLFTGFTMAFGVITWIFSPLKFQADMGILLTFMFLINMMAAILFLPALACFLLKSDQSS